ncbi:MAG: SDR family oxidoreductase [Alphaproteobacteria bacterium]|nr:SDR family oxidoreductase [Alphaproteobacteria bacterium]
MSEDEIARDGLKPGDTVVITGGGGGFGQAFARRFAKLGAKIAIWEIDAASGAQAAAQARDLGAQAQLFVVDLADADAIARAAQQTLEAFGAPYCILNNASVFPRGEVLDLTLQDWDWTFRVNITAPFLIVKAFGLAMIAQKRGCIINLSSGRALEGAPRGANYAATKAAILSLTKSLALEWARHGIRVNAIIPGQSLTAMPLAATPVDRLHAHAAQRVPLGRVGYPEDMAGAAAFLASADAAYITGQGIAVNGGVVMTP